MEFLSRTQRNWRNERVLIRADFNVTIKDNKIKDFSRIDAFCQAKTVSHLVAAGARVILLAHLGRYEKDNPVQSSEILRQPLEERFGCAIGFVNAAVGDQVKAKIATEMRPGDILLLGNCRFSEADEDNSDELAEEFASLCDAFVFDGFGVSHRHQASTTGIMKRRDSYLGYLVEEEVERLKPFTGYSEGSVAVIGGKKLKEKVGAIEGLLKNGWHLILGGVPLNVALKVSGRHIGASLDNEAGKSYDKKMEGLLGEYPGQIHLPKKVIISNSAKVSNYCDIADPIPEGCEIVDCLLSQEMEDLLAKSSRIILAGPLGRFELGFKGGTTRVVAFMNDHPLALVLGGDTAAATNFARYSTGGGSAISYLSTGTLPVLEQ